MRAFETEDAAVVALRLSQYLAVNEAAGVYAKDGFKVKVVRDPWKAKYFIVPYK
jgi:hypothetical protein